MSSDILEEARTDSALAALQYLAEMYDRPTSAFLMTAGLPLHEEIDLPPGAIALRIAVHDLNSGRIGSLEIPLNVPKR